jgi:hypothetical protein
MKASIKICKVGPFTAQQRSVLKRVTTVLTEHNLSVELIIKVKKPKNLRVVKIA